MTHWIDGGETNLENTILLCSTHHRLLHEGGFSIEKNLEADWCFVNARGRIIPDAPLYQPPKTLPPAQGFHAACSGSTHSRVVG